MRCKYVLFAWFTLAAAAPVPGQGTEPVEAGTLRGALQLGEVTVYGSSSADSSSRLSAARIEKFNRTDLSGALNLLPGITLAGMGPRNESLVYVRGFDLRQVPVFMDGIPVYVPYDGYVDMGRFTTADLAGIRVAKGFASILYGANTMGGAINLVSRKPVHRLEVDGRAGMYSGQGYRWNVNAGSKSAKFFYQAGFSQLKQRTYPLSGDFEPRRFQRGKNRENAARNDRKISLKAGFTPNSTDEYVVGFVYQKGEKGNPPYVGDDSRISTRFWKWPAWDKQSLYFVSATAFGKNGRLRTRFYYDTFRNRLFSYDDSTYTTQEKGYAFNSFYDDYTLGGSAEYEVRTSGRNLLKLNVQYKRDVHREHDAGEPVQPYRDHTVSAGIENTFRLLPSLVFVPGVSFNIRNNSEAREYDAAAGRFSDFEASRNHALNAQVGLFWEIGSGHALSGTAARKTRFATVKDRYSYRMGQALPNPALKAEAALNYDLTYTWKPLEHLRLEGSIFNSAISDIIQQVDNVQPGRFQLQNAGKARFYGAEAAVNVDAPKGLDAGANYSFTRRHNRTHPEVKFINVPDHKVFVYAGYTFRRLWSLLASMEYNSERFSTSYGTSAGAFTLVNTKASFKILDFLSVEGGAQNLFDVRYELVEGFPEAGRTFFVNLVFAHFKK